MASVVQLVRVSSYRLKGCGFDSQSRPHAQVVGSIPGQSTYERQTTDVSFSSFSLPLTASLSALLSFLKSNRKKMSSAEDKYVHTGPGRCKAWLSVVGKIIIWVY